MLLFVNVLLGLQNAKSWRKLKSAAKLSLRNKHQAYRDGEVERWEREENRESLMIKG